VIDILRTADGVELYIDGELLEMNFGEDFDLEEIHELHAGGEDHQVIMIRKKILKED